MSNINNSYSTSQSSYNQQFARTQSLSTFQNVHTSGSFVNGATHGICSACNKNRVLDYRGLCLDKCSILIPAHIPEQQYKRYRDRIVLGKLPNT